LHGDEAFRDIWPGIDLALDSIIEHSPHLLRPDVSLLYFLRAIRFVRSERRAAFVRRTYDSTRFENVKRACIDCWRLWPDRGSFTLLRNAWNTLRPESQRTLWIGSSNFGDEGDALRRQYQGNTETSWALGIERNNARTFARIFRDWCSGLPGGV